MTTHINITRLLRQNEQYATAAGYSRTITQGSIVSAWHERNLTKPSSGAAPGGVRECLTTQAPGTAQNLPPPSPPSTLAAAAAMQKEGREAASSVLQLRRARLAKLMQAKRAEFARELKTMGLALNAQDHLG